MITVSKNKEFITNELFSSPQILHHAPNRTQDSGDNYVCRGHGTSDQTQRYIKTLQTETASMYKTPFCAQLSQKNFPRLIWSYVKLNILRKITHLTQKNPRKFDLIKREIARYDEQAELQKMKVIWWKLPPHDQYNTDGHAILDSHAICWKYRSPSEGGEGGLLHPEVQPLSLLYTIFSRKRYPFSTPSIDKWYPFHIPCLELCIPFIAVNALESITKIKCFLNLIKP